MKIHNFSATELIKAYKDYSLTPTDVVSDLFQRIETYNPVINAFVTLNKNEAMRQAETATMAYKNGTPRPLEGVPVAIKDLTNTKGLRTTYGSTKYKNHIPERDATVVERLKQAGAIIMGKTNTPEFGHKATTDNPLFGPTRNPWDINKATGGSSGGSAASIAAGFVPLAEGSDGGGSIRIPASLTGVYGFKPTYGRVPNDNHLDGIFSSHEPFIHYGPLARTVEDLALMFNVLQGESYYDPFSLPALTVSPIKALETLPSPETITIGYTLDFGIYDVDTDVALLFEKTVAKLKQYGFKIIEIPIDMKKNLKEFIHYFETLWTAGLAAGVSSWSEEDLSHMSEGLLEMINRGKNLSAVAFKQLEAYRAYLFHTLQSIFETVDILLSPTLAVSAFSFDEEGPDHINGHQIKKDADWVMTQIYNLTGQPAISIPMGQTSEGTPAGIQAAAKRLDDIQLLQVTSLIEKCLQISTHANLFPLDKQDNLS